MRRKLTAIYVFAFAISLSGFNTQTAAENSVPVPTATPASASAPASQKLETGPETTCKADAECWCRKFTGAKFTDGKSPSRCVRNQCVRCLYE